LDELSPLRQDSESNEKKKLYARMPVIFSNKIENESLNGEEDEDS